MFLVERKMREKLFGRRGTDNKEGNPGLLFQQTLSATTDPIGVFGLSMLCFPSGPQVNATREKQLLSTRSTCPTHWSCLLVLDNNARSSAKSMSSPFSVTFHLISEFPSSSALLITQSMTRNKKREKPCYR